MRGNKDSFLEAGTLVNFRGKTSSDSRSVVPSIRELKELAKDGAWVRKAKVFSDLANDADLEEYNKIYGDPEKYQVLDENSTWADEAENGVKSKTLKCFLKYIELDDALYEKNLKDLLELHKLNSDDAIEEDADIVLNNKRDVVAEKKAPVKKKVAKKKVSKKKADLKSIDVD